MQAILTSKHTSPVCTMKVMPGGAHFEIMGLRNHRWKVPWGTGRCSFRHAILAMKDSIFKVHFCENRLPICQIIIVVQVCRAVRTTNSAAASTAPYAAC